MEKITFPVVLNYNRQELQVTFSPIFLFLFLSDLSLFASPPPYIDKFSTLILPAVLLPTGFSGILFLFFIGFPAFLSWNGTFGGVFTVQVVSYVFNEAKVRWSSPHQCKGKDLCYTYLFGRPLEVISGHTVDYLCSLPQIRIC